MHACMCVCVLHAESFTLMHCTNTCDHIIVPVPVAMM